MVAQLGPNTDFGNTDFGNTERPQFAEFFLATIDLAPCQLAWHERKICN